MATHRDSVEFALGEDEDKTFERVESFLLANGYERTREEPLVYERGEKGAGWWSSEMSKLHAKYMIRLDAGDSRVIAGLDVDTTGQHMTREDLAFWRGELEALREFVESGEDGEAPDLREQERVRAKSGRKETLRLSAYGFVITFVLLFILIVALQRLGILAPF